MNPSMHQKVIWNGFYTDFSSIKDRKWDGFIITGAPIEKMEFEDVEYWDELKKKSWTGRRKM